MPAPALLAPLLAVPSLKAAGWAAAGALALYAVARARGERPREPLAEAALDALPDGLMLDASQDAGRPRADLRARLRRTVRMGAVGPGLSLDFAVAARLRLARAPAGG